MNEIGLEEFDSLRDSATVIDVLPRPSFRSGHLEGAINLPVDEIEDRASQLLPSHDAKLIVYCGGPQCPLGAQAQQKLITLGYSDVLHYAGGLEEWNANGRSLQRELSATPTDIRANRLLQAVNSLSLNQWVAIWLGMVIGCGFIFWIVDQTAWAGLHHNGRPLEPGVTSLGDCLYFSVVTATTLGYGDITPVTTWARALAALEAVGGMVLVGALISKLLSTHQEALLRETHELAFNERLGRIQTSLHLLISEFQDMQTAHETGERPESGIDMRLSSGSAILVRDLRVVRDLLHGQNHRVDESSMELVLVTLCGTLESYLNVLTKCHSDQSRSARLLGDLVEEICAECTPHQYSTELRALISRTHLLAQRILGVASARGGSVNEEPRTGA